VRQAKAVLTGNFITMSAYIEKTVTSQVNNLMMQFKLLEKEEQTKPKTSRQREIIKIRVEINETKTKKLYKESMKQKVGSSKKLIRSINPSQLDKTEGRDPS
jgi:hypothetical protein